MCTGNYFSTAAAVSLQNEMPSSSGGKQTQTESNVNLTPHPTLSSSSPLPSVPYQPLPVLTTAYSSSSSSATESVSPTLHPGPELDDHSTAPGTASSSRNYRPTLPIISSTVTGKSLVSTFSQVSSFSPTGWQEHLLCMHEYSPS